ncbi:WaaY domain-containing protein [Ceratobasidium sp. AG-Ba]|nr:WaaY domain-containing protein [Ceratobasidium sp. AG-Ba]
MTQINSVPDVRLFMFGTDPFLDAVRIEFEDWDRADVYKLRQRYAQAAGLSLNGLRFFKVDTPIAQVQSIKAPSSESLLINEYLLSHYWPNMPLAIINVLVFQQSDLMSNPPDDSNKNLRSRAAAQQTVLRFFGSNTSSTWAQSSNFRGLQNASGQGVLNGRPFEKTGMPIGLYHPIFDAFTSRARESTNSIPGDFYDKMDQLLISSQEMYEKENGRQHELDGILQDILGHKLHKVKFPGVQPDGVIHMGEGGTVMLVMDIKNEIGSGNSDPTIQGAMSYAKYCADKMTSSLLSRCCCPVFILAIAGPWICVLGAVMLEQPVVEPLTNLLWVANSPRLQTRFRRLSQTFWALASSISELKDYYLGLQPEISKARFDPYIQHYRSGNKTVEFTYLEPMGGKNLLKTVFRAQTKLSGEDIVVKFAETYNSRAHGLLAQNGLAPAILYDGTSDPYGPRPSGLYMIVMEYVTGLDLALLNQDIPSCVKEDVQRAITLLHSENMVFGDLRRPNVHCPAK